MNTRIPRRNFLATMAAAGVGLALPTVSAEPARASTARDPDSVLKDLLAGNKRYVEGKMNLAQFSQSRDSLAGGQSPRAVVVACADSRTPPELIFDQNRGELFVVRVAGNFVNDDGLASIEFAVEVLGANLLVVMGHSRCGAVDATIGYVETGETLPGHLPLLVDAIKPAVRAAKGESGDLLTNAIAMNARLNAEKLANASPIISKHVASGRVRAVPTVYDLETGRVEVV
jgi:carbonic anhydrase